MKLFLKYIAFLILQLSLAVSQAEVRLASLFVDHMVLQQQVKVPVWGTANPGEKVSVKFGKQSVSAIANDKGEWKISLSKLTYGGPFALQVTGTNTIHVNDVYVGEVWLCSGQSNMDMTVAKEDRYWCGVINEAEEVANANYPTIRVFDVDFTPKEQVQNTVTGKWEVVSPTTVGHLSAAAYFFARDLQKKLKVPIGLITTAYGASTAEAWIRKEALQQDPKFRPMLDSFTAKLDRYKSDTERKTKYLAALEKWKGDAEKAKQEGKPQPRRPGDPNPERDQHNAYVLWNGMVAAIVPYAIKGALWYQGESNGPTAKIYGDIMQTLITDWRKQWGYQFPFIYVQLANHQKLIIEPVKDDPMVTVRDQQLQNLSVPNTAMVVAIDNTEPADFGNIHPKNKQMIGNRLALAAMGLVYNEKIVYSGPLYEGMKVEGNKIRLKFKSIGKGIEIKADSLNGFAIAGADKRFYHAVALVEGDDVLLSHPEVLTPVAARYAWGKNPPVSLYNKEGLPASPFKTD